MRSGYTECATGEARADGGVLERGGGILVAVNAGSSGKFARRVRGESRRRGIDFWGDRWGL